jgi:hypothetical protein
MKFKKEKRPQKPDFKIGSNFLYNGLNATITKISKENIYFSNEKSANSCMSRSLFEDLVRDGII